MIVVRSAKDKRTIWGFLDLNPFESASRLTLLEKKSSIVKVEESENIDPKTIIKKEFRLHCLNFEGQSQFAIYADGEDLDFIEAQPSFKVDI